MMSMWAKLETEYEFAKDVSEFDTLAEYKEEIKKNLTEKKETEAKKTKEDEAIQKIIDKSKMDLPEAMIETQCETMVEEFAQRIAQSGLTMEQYLQFSGMEADKLKEYMGDAEKESMKKDLAITKAVDLIMDNVKERAKAKKKADAEESTEE